MVIVFLLLKKEIIGLKLKLKKMETLDYLTNNLHQEGVIGNYLKMVMNSTKFESKQGGGDKR